MKIRSDKKSGRWHTEVECGLYVGHGNAKSIKQSINMAIGHWLNRYWHLKREL